MPLRPHPIAKLDYINYYAGTTLINLAIAVGSGQPFLYLQLGGNMAQTLYPTDKMVTK